jgi:sporulation protein YlmC with PRC-barrel domain
MRLSDLQDKKIRTFDGESLGRVHEVHCNEGRVTALMTGPGSFLERLTGKRGGKRIPWECVRRVGDHEIVVTPDPPQRTVKTGGSRSPRRTPRPSARRSKR